MSTAIINSILKFAADKIFEQIKGLAYKPDTTIIDATVGGFGRLETLIKTLDYQNKLWTPMTKIYYWVARVQKTIDDLKAENNEAHRQAYNSLIDTLKSDDSGIRYQTFVLVNVLMTGKSPTTAVGLLEYWESEAYKKLSDQNNTSYHVEDYINELDTNIAAVAALLHHGMVLSMYIASTKGDAEVFRKTAENRVNTFRNTLYDKLYPPVLRQLKSSYGDPGNYLTDGRWFNIYDQSSNKNFLSIQPFFVQQVSLHTPAGDNSVKVRSFRFVASDGKKPLGPLEMHAYWQDRGLSRVKFYEGRPDGVNRTIAYTNSKYSDTSDILFKLLPVQVEGKEVAKSLKLIPYKQSGGSTTKDDKVNTWSTKWRLEEASSPQ
ncbi:hypothetical protein F4801DRAFT_581659 [Xylaria longipes]|nr:hypothetical protein F4801DRAFT_581659 [Xylaria longipes]